MTASPLKRQEAAQAGALDPRHPRGLTKWRGSPARSYGLQGCASPHKAPGPAVRKWAGPGRPRIPRGRALKQTQGYQVGYLRGLRGKKLSHVAPVNPEGLDAVLGLCADPAVRNRGTLSGEKGFGLRVIGPLLIPANQVICVFHLCSLVHVYNIPLRNSLCKGVK